MRVYEPSFVATILVTTMLFWGLAVYVVTRAPRRSIGWVFAAYCGVTGGYYLCSLFLYPVQGVTSPAIPLALRIKWALTAFTTTLYLHLVGYYFPRSWERHRRWLVRLSYAASTGLALAALFTRVLIAGPLYRPPPDIVGPLPGPLMSSYSGLFALQVAAGLAGLLAGYRAARSWLGRRQVGWLLAPTGLLMLAAAVNWVIVLSEGVAVPHELADACQIAAGCLFARAVLRHGSFVGRPFERLDVLQSLMGLAGGLLVLCLATAVDRRLAAAMPFYFPVTASLVVLLVAFTLPRLWPWLNGRLAGPLLARERPRQDAIYRLEEALAGAPEPEDLQAALLRLVCEELGVSGGYLALQSPGREPGILTVRAVAGALPLRRGDTVCLPPLLDGEPVVVASLPPYEQAAYGLGIALVWPLVLADGLAGVMALGEKAHGPGFSSRELAFCREMASQIETTERMARLLRARNDSIDAARIHGRELQRLGQEVSAAAHQLAAGLAREDAPPLAIHLLGPLRVERHGAPVRAEEWSPKTRALLAYLLWRGPAGATRDEICLALWPDRAPEEAANVFHVTLHRLRRLLEPGLPRVRASRCVVHSGGRYGFGAGAWLDVAAFERLAAGESIAELKEAVALYRGPYLEDADLDLPPEVEIRRQELERVYLGALRALVARLPAQEAIPFLQRLLAVQPADEASQRALVEGYLALGRRDLARRQVARWQFVAGDLDCDEPS